MMDKNYYDILGLPKYAGIDEIKAKYRKAVKNLHPDVNVGKPKQEVDRKKLKFEEIQKIYEELSDKTKKAKYDSKLLVKSNSLVKSKFFDDSWGKF